MELKKFAAIDIGSNAIRLFIANIIDTDLSSKFRVNKAALIRTPLRLGEDVFSTGIISEAKIQKFILSMKAFKLFMEVHDVVKYRACATSAMRDALNSKDVIDKIKNETGIEIEIISGKEEADLLYLTENISSLEDSKKFIAIDLGGGSIEFTLFTKNEIILSRSFSIGTIRMLNNQVSEADFFALKNWLKEIIETHHPNYLIGSGGNINKLFRISETKNGEPLEYKKLKNLYKYLDSFTYEDRIKFVELNVDRADVIMPAAEIFLKIMKWTKIKEISVPVIGLSDGIVKQLYKNYLEEIDKNEKNINLEKSKNNSTIKNNKKLKKDFETKVEIKENLFNTTEIIENKENKKIEKNKINSLKVKNKK